MFGMPISDLYYCRDSDPSRCIGTVFVDDKTEAVHFSKPQRPIEGSGDKYAKFPLSASLDADRSTQVCAGMQL
ncbi:hypothetical protein E4U34_002277 [Claviceps purpurea]|nr:hypothetical protein E4U38_000717 [Claviceps purpurea]KAG6169777.1 hypothetical protein E4U51_001389 [Claviceps purpurea]KAG6231712.1 hypothetical protein E4U34_002277 [Claviceps purpurea]KAG6325502.1 hypothetical protein E4U44_003973 [Claviceps purpurea]